jgi:glycosyltransferase involved in cell wall biosynthesis
MRLAVEVTTCSPLRTGIGYYTEHLVDALLETLHEGDDLVLLSNRSPAPELAERWASYLHVSGPSTRAVWMQIGAPHLLAETNTDVGFFPNYALPLASPCPTIAVVHDLAVLRLPQQATLQKRLLMEPMLKQVARSASLIGTVSAASRQDIVEWLGVREDRVALFPGAAHPSCRPAPADAVAAVRARHGLSRPYLLTVGTLEPRKDQVTLLRAFDALRAQGDLHDLVVVGGRGWKDEKLVREIEARGGTRGVRWLGYVPESELAALYSGADLFAFTPALEGFGLPLVEAMACGAPVVATDIPALREVGGDVPRYVSPGDHAAVAAAIREELDDVRGRAVRCAGGLLRARRFSWARTAEAVWTRARAVGPSRVRSRGGVMVDGTPTVTLPPPLHPPPPRLTVQEWALLAAITYADLFESPLPLDHALAASMGIVIDEAKLRRLATAPALSSRVTFHPKGFLVLKGREALVDPMPEREEMTRALLDRYERTLRMLAALPFVRALVISGGVAHRNVGARADIDLFVIAASGRAYMAYTMLFLATTVTGTRRVVCPNYIVDERELSVAYHRDLFTAHQLVSARAYSGQAAYEALCRANEQWVRRFFPSFVAKEGPGATPPSAAQAAAEIALTPVAPALEGLMRWAWRFRLRRRAATAAHADVVLGDGILKLHLSDYRARVLKRFAARLDVLRAQLGADAQPRGTGLDA